MKKETRGHKGDAEILFDNPERLYFLLFVFFKRLLCSPFEMIHRGPLTAFFPADDHYLIANSLTKSLFIKNTN